MTLAILLTSPVLVVGMFAILFRPGAFDFRNPSPSSMVMIGFWVVFAAFFFGITHGLLRLVMPSRWAFDAIGHDLGARRILAHAGSPLGPPLLASFGDAGRASTPTYWLILASFVVVFLVATWGVLVSTTGRPPR